LLWAALPILLVCIVRRPTPVSAAAPSASPRIPS